MGAGQIIQEGRGSSFSLKDHFRRIEIVALGIFISTLAVSTSCLNQSLADILTAGQDSDITLVIIVLLSTDSDDHKVSTG